MSDDFHLSPAAERRVAACAKLHRAAAEVVDAKMAERDYSWKQLAVTALYVRSSGTFESTLILAKAGRGVQAAMLVRSLFEDMVDAHWLSIEPELAEKRFREYAHYFAAQRRRPAVAILGCSRSRSPRTGLSS